MYKKVWLGWRDISEILPLQRSGTRMDVRKKQGNIQQELRLVWSVRAKRVIHKQNL